MWKERTISFGKQRFVIYQRFAITSWHRIWHRVGPLWMFACVRKLASKYLSAKEIALPRRRVDNGSLCVRRVLFTCSCPHSTKTNAVKHWSIWCCVRKESQNEISLGNTGSFYLLSGVVVYITILSVLRRPEINLLILDKLSISQVYLHKTY